MLHTKARINPDHPSHLPPMNEYNLLLRIAIWLRRFRKRCGYGVHSPLAFQFITGVIYNKEEYYPYATLRQPLAASVARLDEYDPQSGLTARDLRLLFRLTNYQEPATIHLFGASPIVRSYISAARTTATIAEADTNVAEANGQPAADLVYCHSTHSLGSIGPLPPSAMVIVHGIHRDATARNAWHSFQQRTDVTLTFDLWRFGIALRRPKMNRQNYVVNYF